MVIRGLPRLDQLGYPQRLKQMMLDGVRGVLLRNVPLVVPAQIQKLEENMPPVVLVKTERPLPLVVPFGRLLMAAREFAIGSLGLCERVFELVEVPAQTDHLGDKFCARQRIEVGLCQGERVFGGFDYKGFGLD